MRRVITVRGRNRASFNAGSKSVATRSEVMACSLSVDVFNETIAIATP